MEVIRDISPKDDMFQGNNQHYFHVGELALECIRAALSEAGKSGGDIRNILDLPSGYGRVLRVLKVAFPEAKITACDLVKDAVDFCAEKFGADPVYSSETVSNIPLTGFYDLIWVGSLFTHINSDQWKNFFELFDKILSPGGLLVVTFHGPYVIRNILSKDNTYGLRDDSLASLLSQYSQNQYGYVNYPFQNAYGISVSTPAYIKQILSQYSDLKFISYKERAWDDHQDVLCCQKISEGSQNIPIEGQAKYTDQNYNLKPERPEDRNVIFCLPEGLTLGGVTSWSIELSRGLNGAGISTYLGIHPSRYKNPPVDFGITPQDHIINCLHLPHPDDPNLNVKDYVPYYRAALPGVLIPSWSWGTYALAAHFASQFSDMLRVIGMAHSDESGYYQWLVHYEAIIHKFIVANYEIKRKLAKFLPQRVDDIYIKCAPVNVQHELIRTYSPPDKPLQIIYGGRIAQYQKRVFDLIELIKALAEEEVNFYFQIIGGGTDKDLFYTKVEQLPKNIRSMVSLEESVPYSQLSELWRSTDINVIVSDFEGVSNSLLMGMAEGCVSVVTEVSGTVQVISSGENGYLLPVGDMVQMAKRIKQIDQDRSQLVNLGKNAHDLIEARYSQTEYTAWFINVLQEVWNEPARPWPAITAPLKFEDIHHKFIQLNSASGQRSDLANRKGCKTILFLSHDANWGGASKVISTFNHGFRQSEMEAYRNLAWTR